jgi:peptide chain release factor 1
VKAEYTSNPYNLYIRVIRVPETEAKGRLHSSTAQMIVTPEIPMEFTLIEKDLEYQYMRA